MPAYAVYYEIDGQPYLTVPTSSRTSTLTVANGEWTVEAFPPEVTLGVPYVTVPVTTDDRDQWDDLGVPQHLIGRAEAAYQREVAARVVAEPAPVSALVAPKTTYVPDASIADAYVHRTVRGVEDFAMLDWARANQKNVLLYGPTGSGKTMLPEAYAATHGLDMALVSGNIAMTTHQILGGLVPDGKGGWKWQDGVAVQVVRNGGLIDLDELNFIPSKIATVLFPLLAGQRHIVLLDNGGEVVHAHPDLLIVATMNPGYAGTLELNPALRNRFTSQVEWGYDDGVEKALVPSKALRTLAGQLRAYEAKGEMHTPTPTNALRDFCLMVPDLGMDWAIGNFLDRYGDDEQATVKLAIDAQRRKIEADFGLAPAPKVTDEPEVDLTDDEALRSLADLKLAT